MGELLQIAAVLALAVAFGMLAALLRQPLIGIFVLTGIVVGPSGLRIISSHSQFELLGSIGISLLLFIGGLKLDIRLLRRVGRGLVWAGAAQVVGTALLALPLVAPFAGGQPMVFAVLALALTFSSTVVGLKVLADRNELDSLPGVLAMGILLIQDFAVVLILIWLDVLAMPTGHARPLPPWLGVPAGAGLLAALFGIGTLYLPPFLRRFARTPEFLTLFAITWATLLAALCETLGLSKELGAFVAGLTFAASPFKDTISSRLAPLRDFLILFFFLDVGARVEFGLLGGQLVAVGLYLGFTLLLKPAIIFGILARSGYSARTSLMSTLPLLPMSEFSFLLAANAMRAGILQPTDAGALTLAGLASFFVSPFVLNRAEEIYRFCRPWLERSEKGRKDRESTLATHIAAPTPPEIIVIGLGEYGIRLCEFLLRRGKSVLGVDFNPDVLAAAAARGIPVHYGDAEDDGLYNHLPLEKARWVVAAFRSSPLAQTVLGLLKACDWHGRVALRADNDEVARLLEEAGAHVVLRPYSDAAELAADSITESSDIVFHLGRWPMAFREVRLPSHAGTVGQSLAALQLRSTTGASVLAISRAGRTTLDPPGDFILYPNDRLLLMGAPHALDAAEEALTNPAPSSVESEFQFDVAEIRLPANSPVVHETLEQSRIRQTYGVTVAAVLREGRWTINPGGSFSLLPNDYVLVVGPADKVEAFRLLHTRTTQPLR
ncbi:MAG: cation:proton antiporter [Candidatus Sumerlaea chitinivorans]|uniref:Sodium/hydrogen exchanger family protein n=1 Tax=Sumerlaea chitinivorans TaxID=2250252 RepID=A0A2Z4Y640_SUMC1|nr:Sodium/hydrogen exchanger family protein [Candidatus Sumerlaea chitinivorans]MCX7964079.1 cation:proton antiporter [Candidatus Sumerlaea chitinivorans]